MVAVAVFVFVFVFGFFFLNKESEIEMGQTISRNFPSGPLATIRAKLFFDPTRRPPRKNPKRDAEPRRCVGSVLTDIFRLAKRTEQFPR